jgi:hypothetical protein
MRLHVLAFTLVAGCGPQFQEIDPGPKKAGELELTACGASTVTTASVIQAMDEPPVGPTGSSMPPPARVSVCMRLENHGDKPARVDRSHFTMTKGRGKQMPEPDKEDDVFVVPPGEVRKFQVTFETSSLVSGEDFEVHAALAVTIDGNASKLPAIKLRKK